MINHNLFCSFLLFCILYQIFFRILRIFCQTDCKKVINGLCKPIFFIRFSYGFGLFLLILIFFFF